MRQVVEIFLVWSFLHCDVESVLGLVNPQRVL